MSDKSIKNIKSLYKVNPTLYDKTSFLLSVPSRFADALHEIVFAGKYHRFVSDYKADASYAKEYDALLARFYSVADSGISRRAGLALYDVIRTRKPGLIVETGVEEGFSSAIILEALERNKKGRLISIDIGTEVGRLAKGLGTNRWTLKTGITGIEFFKASPGIKDLDLFLCDSSHTYQNIKEELELSYPHLSGNAVIMCDDANSNEAFMEFAREKRIKPQLIRERHKDFGILMKRGND